MKANLVLLIGTTVSVILGIISSVTSFFGFVDGTSLSLVASVLLAMFGLMLSERLSTIAAINSLRKDAKHSLSETQRALASNRMLNLFESAETALDSVFEKKGLPVKVINTHIKADHVFGGKERLYSEKQLSKWQSWKSKVVKSGAQWHDLVGKISDTRFDDFLEASRSLKDTKYFLVKCDIDIPYINFIILEYADGRKEVFFGWAYSHLKPSLNTTFHSTLPELVGYFTDIFQHTLNNYSTKILTSGDTK